jgi:hypothetical protein
MVDRSFVREPSYLRLNGDNATGPPDMGRIGHDQALRAGSAQLHTIGGE